MLSKATKQRMRQRKLRRAKPAKRWLLLIKRKTELDTLKIHRNGQFGARPLKDPSQMTTVEKLQEMTELRKNIDKVKELKAQAVAEDKIYFNGWAKGYK